jgi:phospholipid/cholesterol/gamma-HCH transport system substrate-binding protein
MRFRVRFAEQVVGVFVILAFLALAATLVILGVSQGWFARNYRFRSEFLSGNGLSAGMPIKFRGFEIGKIDHIELNGRNTVDVDFHVYETYYPKVRPNSVLELQSSPLGIGGGLVLHAGSDADSPPPPEGSLIPSMDTPEGRRRLAEGLVVVPKADDVVSSIIGQVDPILGEVRRIIRQADALIVTLDAELAGRGTGPVSTLLGTVNGELAGTGAGPISEVLADLASAAERVNRVLDDIEQRIVVDTSEGVGRTLARIDVVLGTIDKSATSLAAMTAALQDPTGLVPKVLGDTDNRILGRIGEALAGVEGVVRELESFVAFVNESQPRISGLLEKGQDTLDQGTDVLTAVRNNPLLRGGVPERREQQATHQSVRDVDF